MIGNWRDRRKLLKVKLTIIIIIKCYILDFLLRKAMLAFTVNVCFVSYYVCDRWYGAILAAAKV